MRHPYPVEVLPAAIVTELFVVPFFLRLLQCSQLMILYFSPTYLHLEAHVLVWEILFEERGDARGGNGGFALLEHAG